VTAGRRRDDDDRAGRRLGTTNRSRLASAHRRGRRHSSRGPHRGGRPGRSIKHHQSASAAPAQLVRFRRSEPPPGRPGVKAAWKVQNGRKMRGASLRASDRRRAARRTNQADRWRPVGMRASTPTNPIRHRDRRPVLTRLGAREPHARAPPMQNRPLYGTCAEQRPASGPRAPLIVSGLEVGGAARRRQVVLAGGTIWHPDRISRQRGPLSTAQHSGGRSEVVVLLVGWRNSLPSSVGPRRKARN
jgi:hypothetical protein